MNDWSSMPWSSALCFLLAAVITVCVLFLIFDAWKHREPKRIRSPYVVGRDCYRDIKGLTK